MDGAADSRGVRGNRRALVRMSEAEIRTYLQAHTGEIVMSTMHPDGSIHSVAMYYGFVDDRIGVLTKRKSQKAQNVVRDRRMTVLVATGTSYEELRGVEIVGAAAATTDPGVLLALANSIRKRRGEPVDDETLAATIHNRVAILLDPVRVVSWDHSKLPGMGGR